MYRSPLETVSKLYDFRIDFGSYPNWGVRSGRSNPIFLVHGPIWFAPIPIFPGTWSLLSYWNHLTLLLLNHLKNSHFIDQCLNGGSWNRGTPKPSILKGFFFINHPFWRILPAPAVPRGRQRSGQARRHLATLRGVPSWKKDEKMYIWYMTYMNIKYIYTYTYEYIYIYMIYDILIIVDMSSGQNNSSNLRQGLSQIRVVPYRLWGFQHSRKYHKWGIGIGSSLSAMKVLCNLEKAKAHQRLN